MDGGKQEEERIVNEVKENADSTLQCKAVHFSALQYRTLQCSAVQ